MSQLTNPRPSGSAILNEFRAAMEAQRSGALSPRFRGGQQRSFGAAQVSRLTAGWTTADASLNALLQGALPVLKARSRQWSRNTGPGRRFLQQVRLGGVGPTGFPMQSRCGDWVKDGSRWVFRLDKLANDAIESAWQKWCRPGNCEVTGKLSFAEVCKLQLEICARDGEYLSRELRGVETPWRYQLQLLATDRLDTAHSVQLPSGGEVLMGVERAATGKAEAFHLLRSNPLDFRGTRHSERVLARDVLHDFVPLDAEQVRGVPWSHAILLGANMLASFEESAVFAARVGASHMGFYTQDAKSDGAPFTPADLGVKVDTNTGELLTEVEPGALELLPPGVDFKSFDARYPTEAFDPFTKARRRDMATGLGVAYHNLSGDMTAVNYSSARIAELAERDGWRSVSHWFIGSFVHRVFCSWLEMSLLAGAIKLPSGSALPVSKLEKYREGIVFRGRGWEWVDPLKEVNAAAIAVREGFTTRSKVVAAKGDDFEDNVGEIAQENLVLADNGVVLGASPAELAQLATQATKADKEDGKDAD
jgi:lambda family phage portal protein